MNKFFRKVKSLWYGLFWGMKATEDTMLKGNTNGIPGTAIVQEVNEKRVSKALLKGEVTQEVEELRYRTYKVDRESKEYEYIAPTLAYKRDKQDSKFVTYENSDNLEIVTIQPNDPIVEDIAESLKYVGGRGKKTKYTLKPRRDFVPRYRIEEYTKRLVIRKMDETHDMLDFYVSKYPNDKDFKSKGFVKEVEKIRDEKIKSDILDIMGISFVTSHAYKLEDMLEFEFDNLWFKEIGEFDGHYIIRFKARVLKGGIDLTKKYYSKTMDEKYKNKAKKEVTVDLFGVPEAKVYVCSRCGKEIRYDASEIDEKAVTIPRDINDVVEDYDNVTEYMDAQISEQTYGFVLCKDCLKKHLEENNLI